MIKSVRWNRGGWSKSLSSFIIAALPDEVAKWVKILKDVPINIENLKKYCIKPQKYFP